MADIMENTVDWCGFDKNTFTNEKEHDEYKVGDDVFVFDMSNYTRSIKKTPFKATIVEMGERVIWVEVDGERLELYDRQIGEAI